jgi:hypothetical protein
MADRIGNIPVVTFLDVGERIDEGVREQSNAVGIRENRIEFMFNRREQFLNRRFIVVTNDVLRVFHAVPFVREILREVNSN